MGTDSVQDDTVVTLPFLEDGEILVAIEDSVPTAAAPNEVIRALRGDVDTEFMAWWVPEQEQWQERARKALRCLIDDHGPSDRWIEGEFPGWYVEWWAQVLEFPWAARLGEAVEAAESWIREH